MDYTLATPPRGVRTRESTVDYFAKHTPGMYSSRDITLIAFLTLYMYLEQLQTP